MFDTAIFMDWGLGTIIAVATIYLLVMHFSKETIPKGARVGWKPKSVKTLAIVLSILCLGMATGYVTPSDLLVPEAARVPGEWESNDVKIRAEWGKNGTANTEATLYAYLVPDGTFANYGAMYNHYIKEGSLPSCDGSTDVASKTTPDSSGDLIWKGVQVPREGTVTYQLCWFDGTTTTSTSYSLGNDKDIAYGLRNIVLYADDPDDSDAYAQIQSGAKISTRVFGNATHYNSVGSVVTGYIEGVTSNVTASDLTITWFIQCQADGSLFHDFDAYLEVDEDDTHSNTMSIDHIKFTLSDGSEIKYTSYGSTVSTLESQSPERLNAPSAESSGTMYYLGNVVVDAGASIDSDAGNILRRSSSRKNEVQVDLQMDFAGDTSYSDSSSHLYLYIVGWNGAEYTNVIDGAASFNYTITEGGTDTWT